MYVRLIRLKADPSKSDEAMKLWSSEVLPQIKKAKGFAGVTVVGDKKKGETISITYWETEQAMKEAKGSIRPEALKSLDKTGSKIVEEDECEVAVLERFQPAKTGVFARLTTVEGNPSHVSAGVANYKENILPVIKKQNGVRTAYLFVNKAAGKSFGGSVYDTEADLQKSEANLAGLRAEAAKKVEAKTPRVELFEVLFTEVPTHAGH
jgi:heme-degrading monooxygenase HmoA